MRVEDRHGAGSVRKVATALSLTAAGLILLLGLARSTRRQLDEGHREPTLKATSSEHAATLVDNQGSLRHLAIPPGNPSDITDVQIKSALERALAALSAIAPTTLEGQLSLFVYNEFPVIPELSAFLGMLRNAPADLVETVVQDYFWTMLTRSPEVLPTGKRKIAMAAEFVLARRIVEQCRERGIGIDGAASWAKEMLRSKDPRLLLLGTTLPRELQDQSFAQLLEEQVLIHGDEWDYHYSTAQLIQALGVSGRENSIPILVDYAQKYGNQGLVIQSIAALGDGEPIVQSILDALRNADSLPHNFDVTMVVELAQANLSAEFLLSKVQAETSNDLRAALLDLWSARKPGSEIEQAEKAAVLTRILTADPNQQMREAALSGIVQTGSPLQRAEALVFSQDSVRPELWSMEFSNAWRNLKDDTGRSVFMSQMGNIPPLQADALARYLERLVMHEPGIIQKSQYGAVLVVLRGRVTGAREGEIIDKLLKESR